MIASHDDHERGIHRQEWAGQFGPAEVVGHYVEDAFAGPTLVVIVDDLFWARFLVVGHDRPACVGTSTEQIFLINSSFNAADDQPVGRGLSKRCPGDLGHIHLLSSQPYWRSTARQVPVQSSGSSRPSDVLEYKTSRCLLPQLQRPLLGRRLYRRGT